MLTSYTTHCRAAGMRPATIRLRLIWLRRAATDLDLVQATPNDLLTWLGSHDWAPETRRSARSALKSFYGWAVDNEVRRDNPAARLPSVRVPLGVPRPAPTDVLQRALSVATDRDRLMIALAAFAGLRRTEIAALPWSSMRWQGLYVVGKGGRARTVPLLPRLSNLMADEAKRRDAGTVGTGFRYEVEARSPYLFPSHMGGHMHPDTVGPILSAALGPNWTGHNLRHRFATLAYEVDRDLLTVQQLLGHSKPETTARYTAIPHGAAMAAVAGVAA